MDVKKCSHCGKYKPLSDFWKKSDTKDGLQSSCKECILEMRQRNQVEKALKKTISEKKRSKQIFGKEFGLNEALKAFTDKQLLYEIRNRGYHGILKYSEDIEL